MCLTCLERVGVDPCLRAAAPSIQMLPTTSFEVKGHEQRLTERTLGCITGSRVAGGCGHAIIHDLYAHVGPEIRPLGLPIEGRVLACMSWSWIDS